VYGDTGDNPPDTVRPEQLEANLQSVAEAALEAISDEAGGESGEFSAAISQTLKHLSENAENLQVSNRNVNSVFFRYMYDAVTQFIETTLCALTREHSIHNLLHVMTLLE
jgi:hypothetical protein